MPKPKKLPTWNSVGHLSLEERAEMLARQEVRGPTAPTSVESAAMRTAHLRANMSEAEIEARLAEEIDVVCEAFEVPPSDFLEALRDDELLYRECLHAAPGMINGIVRKACKEWINGGGADPARRRPGHWSFT